MVNYLKMEDLVCCCCYCCCSLLTWCSNSRPRQLQVDVDTHELLPQQEKDDCYPPYEDGTTISLPGILESSSNKRLSSPTTSMKEFSMSEKRTYRIVNEGVEPKLKCLVVPSYGDRLLPTVAAKESGGDFLKGVGEDSDIIQELIGKDSHKDLIHVQAMFPHKQVKLEEFLSNIERKMMTIKLKKFSKPQKGRKYIP